MNDTHMSHGGDSAPGETPSQSGEVKREVIAYVIGFALATGLTLLSFFHHTHDFGVDPEHSSRALRFGNRADGRSPRVFPAHHHRSR